MAVYVLTYQTTVSYSLSNQLLEQNTRTQHGSDKVYSIVESSLEIFSYFQRNTFDVLMFIAVGLPYYLDDYYLQIR